MLKQILLLSFALLGAKSWDQWYQVPEKAFFIKDAQSKLETLREWKLNITSLKCPVSYLKIAVSKLKNYSLIIESEGKNVSEALKGHYDDMFKALNPIPEEPRMTQILDIYTKAYEKIIAQLERLNSKNWLPMNYLETIWHLLHGNNSIYLTVINQDRIPVESCPQETQQNSQWSMPISSSGWNMLGREVHRGFRR